MHSRWDFGSARDEAHYGTLSLSLSHSVSLYTYIARVLVQDGGGGKGGIQRGGKSERRVEGATLYTT